MNVKRFTGRNSREAMQKVRQAFGDNAVVLSTKPCEGGIEVLAMAPESVEAIEHYREAEPVKMPAASAGQALRAAVDRAPQVPSAPAASAASPVQEDVSKLAMSTLSFQDYVRERMLKKRDTELRAKAQQSLLPDALEERLAKRTSAGPAQSAAAEPQREAAHAAAPQPSARAAKGGLHGGLIGGLADALEEDDHREPHDARRRHEARGVESQLDSQIDDARSHPAHAPAESASSTAQRARRKSTGSAQMMDLAIPAERRSADSQDERVSRKGSSVGTARRDDDDDSNNSGGNGNNSDQGDMMRELRAMKGLIEERFGALAFMERLQKSPKQAQLITRLIDCGFSPALIRKLVDSVGDEMGDEIAWATEVLQRNLVTGEQDASLEDQGGVFALIGSTGVGKTTSTAKLAAAFAARHGAGNLGLITLDAYRLGAHEQLRAYGRILGVPVHTAHDRVALEDLLDLLSAKKLVLIDTAGLAQRDTRTRELLEMLSHPKINRLLVVNAAAQGETIEDVLSAYKAANAKGIVLSKLDEAVKLAPALDAMIRHRLKIVAVANGQRVPEDWHRLTAQALIHRALRATGTHAWRMDANDVNLLFANAGSPPGPAPVKRSRSAASGSSGHTRRAGL